MLIAKKEEEAQLNQLYGIMEGEDDKIIEDECEGTIQNLKEQIEELKRIIQQKDKQIDEVMKHYSLIFEYTGEVQEWEVPITGIYKLEVYGAQGGSYTYGGIGGKGGYCAGNYQLNAGKKIYVVVGSMPESSSQTGGYNGGGFGGTYSLDSGIGSGGGGATHIATSNKGILSNYKENQEDILIVAGGGGGGMVYKQTFYNGGAGGGITSAQGNAIAGYQASALATQEAGFSFGQGQLKAIDTGGTRGGGRRWLARWIFKFGFTGSGGSGYLNPKLMNAVSTTGGATNGGNGRAIITWVQNS